MKRIIVITLLSVMLSMTGLSAAIPVIPSYNTADVDGNPGDPMGEWTEDDFFANMYEAGNENKQILSKAYLRYCCDTDTLYVMVLLEPGFVLDTSRDNEQWVKFGTDIQVDDTSGDDGVAPDFKYIENENGDKIGWEASLPLAEGTYNDLRIHALVFDDRTSSTLRSESLDLTIQCPPPTEVPEFPTVALPIAAIIGMVFVFQQRRNKE